MQTETVRVLPFVERMGVVTELMVALDLATRSGQEHLMNKVLTILRRELLDTRGPLAEPDLASLSAPCQSWSTRLAASLPCRTPSTGTPRW